MKKLLGMFLVLLFVFFAATSSSAYVGGNYDSFCFTDRSGAYRVACSGRQASVYRFASENTGVELTLPCDAYGVCGNGGVILFLCNDVANNQLAVYVYSLDKDALDSFCIYGIKLYNDTDFCCDGSYLYIENDRDSKELRQYSLSGSFVKSYSFSRDITSAFCGYSSGIFVTGGDDLYRIAGNSFSSISGVSVSSDLFSASDSYLVSSSGGVYRVSGSVERLFDIGGGSVSSACVVGNRIYCPEGGYIVGYDLSSGERACSYKPNDTPVMLYSEGDDIISFSGNNSSVCIDRGSFTDLRRSESNNGGYDTGGGDNGSNPVINKGISSNSFRVIMSEMRIAGIPPGTTVAGFRSGMSYPGYTAAVFKDSAEKKSGNVGTAMTAVFSSDGESHTFELSVIGDLTGEGNVNSRDLKLLMDHLIGAADFNGVYSISADISDDGKVDVVDLAMMARK